MHENFLFSKVYTLASNQVNISEQARLIHNKNHLNAKVKYFSETVEHSVSIQKD